MITARLKCGSASVWDRLNGDTGFFDDHSLIAFPPVLFGMVKVSYDNGYWGSTAEEKIIDQPVEISKRSDPILASTEKNKVNAISEVSQDSMCLFIGQKRIDFSPAGKAESRCVPQPESPFPDGYLVASRSLGARFHVR